VGILTTSGLKAGTRDVWAEDVADVIADVSPDEHPLMNLINAIPIDSLKKEWVVKRLNAVKAGAGGYTSSTLGVKQRSETNPDHVSADVNRPARAVIDSYVQNFSQDIEVSDRTQAINPFGVNDEFSLQSADGTKECAKEMEAWTLLDVLTTVDNSSALGTATDPTRMKTLIEQMTEARAATELNFLPNFFSANPIGTRLETAGAAKISSGAEWDAAGLTALAPLSEPMVTKSQELMQGSRDTGGTNPDILMLPPANYGQAGPLGSVTSGSYGAIQFNIDSRLKRLIRITRFIDSQYGPLAVMNNRWLQQANNASGVTTFSRTTDPFTKGANSFIGIGLLFERKFVAMGFLIPFTFERLARTGTSHKGVVSGDGSIVLRHPLAAGVTFGLNNV